MSPDIKSKIFQLRENTHYYQRHTLQFMTHPIHSAYNWSESASYLGPKIWDLISPEIKAIESLAGFKEKIKKWKPNDYPCRLCQVFISNVCFI